MLFLQSLDIVNFRNLEQVRIEAFERFNCISGLNGAGKTNLLDTVYFLSIGKSYFQTSDRLNIRSGEKFFSLDGIFLQHKEKVKVHCAFVENERKKVQVDGKAVDSLASLVGQRPVVFVTPDDINLINGGGEERRKFLDFMLSLTQPEYLARLMEYQSVLKQRNSLLKQIADENKPYAEIIEWLDLKLVELGNFIFTKRKELEPALSSLFSRFYHGISGGREVIHAQYISDLENHDYLELLKSHFEKDKILLRTGKGIHRDELELNIDGMAVKKFASQGQKKSLLLAMKLAQYEFIAKALNIKPILLLDDLFDKLDFERTHNLIQILMENNAGQTFITDTREDRLKNLFARKSDVLYIKMESGHASL